MCRKRKISRLSASPSASPSPQAFLVLCSRVLAAPLPLRKMLTHVRASVQKKESLPPAVGWSQRGFLSVSNSFRWGTGGTLWGGESHARNNTEREAKGRARPLVVWLCSPHTAWHEKRERVVGARQAGAKTIKRVPHKPPAPQRSAGNIHHPRARLRQHRRRHRSDPADSGGHWFETTGAR